MSLITISQNLGSGGMAIARQVAETLKIDLYDDNRLQAEALTLDIPPEVFKNLDEKAPGLFDRILGIKPDVYLDLIQAVVYEASRYGRGVIIGHGSQVLLREFGCALHVRIHAPMARRLRNLMHEQNLNRESAEKLIRKNDSERNGFFKFAFQHDIDDPSLYDLIINTEKLGSAAAVKTIIDLAATEQVSSCSLNALEAMEKISQMKKVEAVLLENDINLTMLHVEVPQKGILRINGITTTQDEKDRILEAVQAMPEFAEFESNINVASGGY
jgi:cytidylate kinase